MRTVLRGLEGNNNNTGAEPHVCTSEGNLHGLGSRPFSITATRWCGNGCLHLRPHPGLTSLKEFTCTSARTLSAYLVQKSRECEPRVKKLQLLVPTGPRTLIFRLYDVIASRSHDSSHSGHILVK